MSITRETAYDKISFARGTEQEILDNIGKLAPYEPAISQDTDKVIFKTDDGSIKSFGIGSDGKDTFVNKAGDTMTGELRAPSIKILKSITSADYHTGQLEIQSTAPSTGAMTASIGFHNAGKNAHSIQLNHDWAGLRVKAQGGAIGNLQANLFNANGQPVYSPTNKPTPADIGAVPGSDIYGGGGSGSTYGKIPKIGTDGVLEIGKYIDFHDGNSTSDFTYRITNSGAVLSTSGALTVGNRLDVNGNALLVANNNVLTLKTQGANQGLYILNQEYDGSNSWYIGKGSANNNNITLHSYKHNTNITLESDKLSANKTLYSAGHGMFGSVITRDQIMIQARDGMYLGSKPGNALGFVNTSQNSWIWDLDNAGNMRASGNVTAYSDRKLKKDLEIIPDALEKISNITGYTYTRIDSGERQAGVIAQDIQKVLPEVVTEYEENGEKTLGVAYGNMVALLVEGIKELNKKNEILMGKILKLEEGNNGN